jgi:hypothetical protein
MSVFTNASTTSSPEQARAYTAAVIDLVGARNPIDILRDTPAAVRRAVDGLAVAQLAQPEAAGKWSMCQVVRHLADAEIVWGWRLRLVLAQDRPTLTGYDQDLWADRLHYAEANVASSLEELTALRRTHVGLLEAAPPADLRRVGVHAERGDESVAHMMRMYAGHDLLHLNQLARIRATVSARR